MRPLALLSLLAILPCTAVLVACGGDDQCRDIPEDDCGGCCDTLEPNGHPCTATWLGNFTDSPDTSSTITGLTIGAMAGDEADWFEAYVVDEFDLGGNPWITVSVGGAGADSVALAGWYDCTDGRDRHTCTVGIADTSFGTGCRALDPRTGFRLDASCGGTDDEDGTLRVRVLSNPSATTCASYELSISVR